MTPAKTSVHIELDPGAPIRERPRAAKVRIFRSASVRPYIGYVLSTTRNGNC
jgi:hypothetical protein